MRNKDHRLVPGSLHDVQKLTDKYVAKVDEKCAAKEKEIMDL